MLRATTSVWRTGTIIFDDLAVIHEASAHGGIGDHLDEHPSGTTYRAVVRHGDPAQGAHHDELGFYDAWGSVTEALATIVENVADPQVI